MQPHLRPLDTGELLDAALQLYRRHPPAYARAGLPPRVSDSAYVIAKRQAAA